MPGYYLMHRGWLDHPIFGGSRREPYCRRSAWVWLIDHAAFEPTMTTIAGKPVELQRGQLSYSYRYLAEAWGWSEAKVRRYCVAVASVKMISCVTDAGQAVITICNYDKYQVVERVGDAGKGASVTQHRRSTDANKKEVERIYTSEANASEAADEPSVGASELAPLDAASVLIGRCTAWLAKATCRQERSLRGLVVGMLKRYGDGAVLEVFTAASRSPPVDPVAWIEAKLQQRERRNGRTGKPDPITGWYAGFNEALNGGSGDSEPDSPPDGTLLGSGYAH